MSQRLARLAGSALLWRGLRMVGIKLIFLVRTFVLARLLVPDDFGLLAISFIAVDVLNSVTDFGMIPALVQRPKATEREYNTAWTVGMLRAFGVSAVVMLAAPFVAELFSEPRAVPLIRVVALLPLLEAAASIKVSVLIRQLRFDSLALVQLPEALINAAVSIALAPWLGVWALIVGALAAKSVYLLLSYLVAPHWPRLVFDTAAARPLIRFGRWIFVVGVVTVAGRSILQAIVSRRLGTAELGLYFLAARVAFLPYELTNEVVGAVAFPMYVRLREERERAAAAFRSILTGIAALIVPICVLMFVLAPGLVEDLLGTRWSETVPLIRILALVSLVGLLRDVAGPFFHGIGRPDRNALIETVQAGLLVVCVWFLTVPYGVAGAALAWLFAVGAVQILVFVLLAPQLPWWSRKLPAPLAATAAASLLGAALAWAVEARLSGLVGLLAAGLLAVAVTGGVLWLLDRRLSLGLAEDLVRAFPQLRTILRYVPAGGE